MNTDNSNPSNQNPAKPRKGECIRIEVLAEYAEGKLSGVEANSVEKHLAACMLCTDALEGIIAFDNKSEFLNTVHRLNQMAAERARQPVFIHKKPNNKARVFTFSAIASVAAVLLVVFLVMPKGPASIAGKYYETYPGENYRGAGSEMAESKAAEAMKLYNSGNFAEAGGIFSALEDSRSQFYAGNSFIETRDYDRAAFAYVKVISLNNSYYVADAKFYLGLTFLFNGETGNGLKLMKEIASDPEGDYSKKAAAIVEALE